MKQTNRSIFLRSLSISISLVIGAALASCQAPDEPLAPPDDVPGVTDAAVEPPDMALSLPDLTPAPTPFYLTGSFDGGFSPYRTWVASMAFAREFERDFGRSLHLTYFITTSHYDPSVTGSAVGRAQSRDEVIVRWALTQQALNEGHEIANHSVRHLDGGMWTEAQWRTELGEFEGLVRKNLFVPVRDEKGEPVFPRWRAAPGAAPKTVGAACADDSGCETGLSCARVTGKQGFCTRECNQDKKCPTGTVCGYPQWTGPEYDVCLPRPELPLSYMGQELFSADGTPNLAHPALKPYTVVGFRAPQLARNDAMFKVLGEMKYVYDTSLVLGPQAPGMFGGLQQFALMKYPSAKTIPMDYNYLVLKDMNGMPLDPDGKVMEADYRASLVEAYATKGRIAWNVGHHLRLYSDGAYFETFKKFFRFAGQGCPDELGRKRCEHVAFPSFRELAPLVPTGRALARSEVAEPSGVSHSCAGPSR